MQKTVLLIISGSIASYKSLELIRLLKKEGHKVTSVLTKAGAQFVTPLSVAGISGEQVYQDLFSLKDESEMGHIRLSREADIVVVAPASADIMAKMAHGLADDLATTLLLATSAPVVVAPAMNIKMWEHVATKRNTATLKADGIHVIEPEQGELACGETGSGRMAEPTAILKYLQSMFK